MVAALMALVPCWALADGPEGDSAGRENQPPVLQASIPLQNIPDSNVSHYGHHLVNLSKYFSDDQDSGNLTFSVVYASDPTHIFATVDGEFLSFTAMADWYGQERFRVRATDSGGLWAESNNFTVRVTHVICPPDFGPLPDVWVFEGEERFFDLLPYILDVDSKLNQTCVRTNSSFVRADGTTLYVNVLSDEPFIDVRITVNHTIDECSGNLRIWIIPNHEHLDGNPYAIVLTEDQFLCCSLGDFGPLNPDAVWTVDSVNAGDPPFFTAKVIDNDTLRLDAALHRYGTGWSISTTASVPGGQKYHYLFTVSIRAIGIEHRLTPVNDTTVSEHQNVSFRLIKEDPWDDLRFRTNTTLFNITPQGWVNFTPDQKEVGRWHIYYTVSGYDTVAREFNLTVLNVNEPPENATIEWPLDKTKFLAGRPILCTANATDPDGDTLFYWWYDEWGIVLGMGKQFNLTRLNVGIHDLFVEVSDGEYSIRSAPVTVVIAAKQETDTDKGPSIVPYGVLTVIIGTLAAVLAAVWASRGEKR
jgi:hypothetical protein